MPEIIEMKPKISIITVCLNSGKYLEGAIRSVCEQVYPNVEYIVVDGGSVDSSAEIFAKYRERIDKLSIEKDAGAYDAMNKGIKAASGDIIYFLNSDDRFYDSRVAEKAAAFFEENKETDFIYGNLAVSDVSGQVSYIEKYPDKPSKWLFMTKTIAHPVTFFRRRCFDKVGYYNQDYRIAGDYDWYLRAIFIKKLKSMHIDANISIFRPGGISSTDNGLREYFKERICIQKKYFNALEVLYTRFLFAIKLMLGRRWGRFFHSLRVYFLEGGQYS